MLRRGSAKLPFLRRAAFLPLAAKSACNAGFLEYRFVRDVESETIAEGVYVSHRQL
jgi:hypothetical protein